MEEATKGSNTVEKNLPQNWQQKGPAPAKGIFPFQSRLGLIHMITDGKLEHEQITQNDMQLFLN